MGKKIRTLLAGYVTSTEAENQLGLSASAGRIRQLCRAGRFPGAVQIGRTWVIPEEAWTAYLAEVKARELAAAAAS